MTALALHPDHLADLRKSGLTDETIAAAQIHSVRPHDLGKLGPNLSSLVQHAYQIPYRTLDGKLNGFARLKLFPAPSKTLEVRYWQPAGSPVHLYFPASVKWQDIASDATQPLSIPEGEKKALAACQRGLTSLGLGGCWSWKTTLDDGSKIVLPDLELFVWQGRRVELVPDSDAWHEGKRVDVLAGFFALAMELTSRGASVHFLKLPDLSGLQKTGLDDWLLRAGALWQEEFTSLERIPLNDPTLFPLVRWHQAWKAKQAFLAAAKTGDAEKPDVQILGGVIRLEWKAFHVRMVFDRLNEERGNTKAELTVAALEGSTALPILSNVKMNLTGGPDRQKCVAMLKKNGGTETPWSALVERAFRTVLDLHRQGEPLVRLTAETVAEPLTFLLRPLAYKDKTTVLYGPPDLGKSYLLMLCAMLVSTGESVAGISGRKGVPLYLDYEDGPDEHGRRLQAIQRAHPTLAAAEVLYQRCTEPLITLGPQLQRRVAEEHVTAIFLDSLGMACGSDPQNPDSAMKVFRTIRSLQCSELIAAHTPKNTPENTEPTIYGSVFHTALTRSAWFMRKEQEAGERVSRIALFNKKHNADGGQRPMGFEVSFTKTSDGQDATHFQRFEVADDPALATSLGPADRVKCALRRGAKRVKTIAEETGVKENQVRSILGRGKEKWCVKVGEMWGLIASTDRG